MKSLFKTLLAGSALVVASASSQAALLSINFSDDANAESNFLASLVGPKATETFDNPLAGEGPANGSGHQNKWVNSNSIFNTAVGTFELVDAGQFNDNAHNDQLMIESKNTGEFGRESLAGSATDFWLDSNDAEKVTWTFGAPLVGSFNAFGFYISDATDQGATLTLKFTSGDSVQVVLPSFNTNGNVGYVTVKSDSNIIGGVLEFINSTGTDGWGIDDVTVGTVPEPSTLLLMGLGLLGLGAARRRNAV